MVKFADSITSRGFFSPQRFEGEVFECEVQGEIPQDLKGAFIRVGSQWAFPPKNQDDSVFNEDGYISSFRFRDGKVSYKGRWIQTERFINNKKAGRQLYGYYRNPFDDDKSVFDPENPSRRSVYNTSPLVHAGKLYATKEDALPLEIDPVTLETRSVDDFGGNYKAQTFTAHAKHDPKTGDMISYGFEATGLCTDDLWIYVIDKSGKVKKEIRIKVPYVSMVHDIAISDKYIIIPVFGYVSSLELLKSGKSHWEFDGKAPTYFGVLSRDGDGQDIRWFKGPNCAMIHTVNAHDKGDKLILDAPVFSGNPFPFFPNADGSRWNPKTAQATIRRITFDMSSDKETYEEEVLFGGMPIIDLVRIDDRFVGKEQRYMFTEFHDPSKPFDVDKVGNFRRRVTNCYGRFDYKTGEVKSYFVGSHHSLQEVQFVPKSQSAKEGEGYLIGTVSNFADFRTELVIIDAENPEAGELARVILPFRASQQVHGKWVGEDQVEAL